MFPGYAPGTELGWGTIVGGPEPTSLAIDHYKYVVFKDATWDWRTFNIDRDVAVADKVDNGTINAVDPNIQPFTGRGGKLLMYHGWADPLVAPGTSINYYNSVREGARRPLEDRGVGPAVHGAGHGSLRRWRRTEYVRCHRGARAMGRSRVSRRNGSSHRTRPTAWSIARGRSARIPRSPSTKGPAARMTRPTLCAGPPHDERKGHEARQEPHACVMTRHRSARRRNVLLS